ncbi:hypothetical protein PPACK8108_LOCUS5679 [Phakopsora pachyrhizi]|uniref:Uncharacterized protein n=1 Tax=Phakopsora pachyrhizi TaxID=170000 RepID=A0AAV0APF5_PHAPC|nr:hypothetical protein PPACK8108_LOCUS5679 [Phakopsora pachyrhizi]
MEQEQHVVSMKKQIKKLKTQLSDLEDRVHAVESTLRQQSFSAYQVANKQTQKVPIQISVSTTKSGIGQNKQTDCCQQSSEEAKVDLSNKKPTSSDSVTTRPSSSKGLPQPRPVVTAQSTKSPQISTPTSVSITKTVSHKVKLQSNYSNSTIQRFTLIPKSARLYDLVRSDFRGLCLPNDTKLYNNYRFESTDRKVALDKIQPQAARLIRKGSAGVWVWNSEMQAGEYLSLKRKSTRPSLQKLVSRFSGWATDGKAGHPPPSTEMMPAKLLEKFEEFKGYRWYWFRDRWLLFTLHEE